MLKFNCMINLRVYKYKKSDSHSNKLANYAGGRGLPRGPLKLLRGIGTNDPCGGFRGLPSEKFDPHWSQIVFWSRFRLKIQNVKM